MNQTIRKLLSIMLAAIMLFALIPAAAAEQEEPAEPIAAEEPTVETETEPEEPAEAPASTEEEPAEVPAEDVQENAEEIEDVDAEKQAAEEKILVNAANFPDAKFLSWVLTKLNPKPEYDSEIGYYLTKENIEKVTTIDCSGQSIGSVKGIELFPNLATLKVNDNSIEDIDLTKNAKLKEIDVSDNKLTALKLSGNPVLTTLYCSNNELEALDISQNTKLSRLICKSNRLTKLDVNASTHKDLELFDGDIGDQTTKPQAGMKTGSEFKFDLTYLVPKANMSSVKMLESTSTLDKSSGVVTFKSEVATFGYSYATGAGDSKMEVEVPISFKNFPTDAALLINESTFPDDTFRSWIIANLAVSGNASDGYYMTKAQVEAVVSIDCSGKGITNLGEIAAFTNLTTLNAEDNKISTLDLTKLTKLTQLNLNKNQLTTLVLTKNTKLVELQVGDNALTALDLSKNTALETVKFPNNKLTAADLGTKSKLKTLDCSGNELASLDVHKCTALVTLNCSNNKLTSLTVTALTKLETLNCGKNELTELNLAKNAAIKTVDCSKNKLATLTVSSLKKLENLNCSGNALAELDVSKCETLLTLDCSENKLAALNVAKCTALEALKCGKNAFTGLSFPENTNLKTLECPESGLTKLDVSKNTKLENLVCNDNKLTEIELSKNTALKTLNCENNNITMIDLSSNTALTSAKCDGQTTEKMLGQVKDSLYTFSITKVISKTKIANVTLPDSSLTIDPATGIITFPAATDSFVYAYATGFGSTKMKVTVPTLFSTLSNAIEFEDVSTLRGEKVEVDGIAYSVAEGVIALPDGVTPKVVTQYAFNSDSSDLHTVYPTSMRVWFVQEKSGVHKAVYATDFENILQYKGSSIRITGKKGIRMITGVPKTQRDSLISKNGLGGYILQEYGTLVIWDSDLGTKDLTLDTPKVMSAYAYNKEKKADPIFAKKDGLIQYTNVLTFDDMEKCKPDLAMRPYMKLTNSDGDALVIYGGIIHRNIGYIAYQNRNAFKSTTAAYKYIWEIIHAVYGNLYDADYKG